MAHKRDKDRIGDVLGLGDAASSSKGGAHEAPRYERDAEHRRRRMSEGADEVTPSATAPHHSSGATGIDMGSGGEGTDVE
jgi:hypothetical protein